jgi:DNA invertase Pin-like site-specific DNA recombinase
MKKPSKPAVADPARKQVVIYARVSSKEQEKEGFSIPAQLKLLKEYAATNGFAIAQEYVDVETAKQTGRAAFGEMVAYLRTHPSVRVMLVEKTDRLYRNLKDWVTVDELDVEMHFPKEGVVLSRESRSSEKFMHGIKVLMAKNYIDNLSEEARKGDAGEGRAGYLANGGAPRLSQCRWSRRQGTRSRVGADHLPSVRMVRDGDAVAERGSPEGEGGRARVSQERCRGAGEYSSRHATQSALYGRVRVEWECVYTKGSTSHWSAVISGDACRAFWMLDTPRSTAASNMIFHFRA